MRRVRLVLPFLLTAAACAGPPAAAVSPAASPPSAPIAGAIAPPAGSSSGARADVPAVDPALVRAAAISARIRFLSDDLLEGRFTGSRGHAIAERYVATELQSMGAEPAGDAGSFLQTVPMRGAVTDPAKTSLVVHAKGKPDLTLKLEDEFILGSDMRTPSVDLEAPLVFVGYGITAPEYHYDDLGGVDLKGKIAVVLSGAPLGDRDDFFPATAHAVYAATRDKVARVAAAGAKGVLIVFRPEDEERLPWARTAKASRIEQMAWLKDGEPGTSAPGAPLRGTLHWKAFDAILARAGVSGGTAALVEAARTRSQGPLDLAVTAHGKVTAKLRELVSHNVAGVLRGSDPKLAQEYVVYSAHLDHLGIAAPVDGDTIYNGALDNASGTAAMLEVAHAYAALARRPARSILFLACTGEERGLLGSDYFARFPTVPAGSIVADLNDDMTLSLAPVHDVVALGAEHSSLGPLVVAAARSLGLPTSPDPEPKQVHFVRSDQYSFVKQGIPSVMVEPGLADEHADTIVYTEKRKAWVATRYHSPKDEWDPAYDYEGMAQVARIELLVGLGVANAPERPRWNPGDVLGTRFGGSSPVPIAPGK